MSIDREAWFRSYDTVTGEKLHDSKDIKPPQGQDGNGRTRYTHQHEVSRRILHAWAGVPEQRLTQFIINALEGQSVFYVTDEALAVACEHYSKTVREIP